MIDFLQFASVVLAYLFIVGLTAANNRRMLDQIYGAPRNSDRAVDRSFGSFWAGVLFPIGWAYQIYLAFHLPRPSKDEKRRAREIAEANHQLALQQINAKAIAAAEKNAGLR